MDKLNILIDKLENADTDRTVKAGELVKVLKDVRKSWNPDGGKCPACGKIESVVIDSRMINNSRWRRRSCSYCETRWTTNEYLEKMI